MGVPFQTEKEMCVYVQAELIDIDINENFPFQLSSKKIRERAFSLGLSILLEHRVHSELAPQAPGAAHLGGAAVRLWKTQLPQH